MKKILVAAFKSDELQQQLEDVIAVDDKVEVNDIPDATIISEAHYVLGKFTGASGGFDDHENALSGEDGPEQLTWAKDNVKALKAFLKKFDPTAAHRPGYVK
jgi:hypothetical protein